MVADVRLAAAPVAPVATDFYGLGQLKARAAREEPEALGEAARQFEALFLQMMLKSMRNAGAAFAEDRDRSYDEMLDQQLAVEMTRQGSIGIADLLVRQIELRDGAHAEGSGAPPWETSSAAPAAAPPHGLSTRRREDFRPTDPQAFLAEIWPLAQATADELGVDARTIVAQAALETGWGQRILRDGRGVSSNNLFGLKAGGGWPGERVAALTLEHDAAAGFVPRIDAFRAYGTLAEGFTGYAEFLRSSARYDAALAHGRDADAFADELQAAGYATDPGYARKLQAILHGPRLTAYLTTVSGVD